MKTYYAINDPSKFNEVINYYDKSLGCTIVFNDSKKLKVLYDALLNSKDFSIAINRKHGFTIKDADGIYSNYNEFNNFLFENYYDVKNVKQMKLLGDGDRYILDIQLYDNIIIDNILH